MSRSASPPGNIGLASSAWAPTANSRTHAARVARQEAGISTFFLASAPELASGFVGSAEIRWDGNATRTCRWLTEQLPSRTPAHHCALCFHSWKRSAQSRGRGAGVAVRTGPRSARAGWPVSRSAAPAA